MNPIISKRTGPQLAPGQSSIARRDLASLSNVPGTKVGYSKNARLRIAVRKIKPGTLARKGSEFRKEDMRQRAANPEMEGRGAGFLSKILEAMKGEPLQPPLLARLKTLNPEVLKDILGFLKTQGKKAYDPVGPMGTGPLRRLPTAAERKAPGYQGVAPPPGPLERLKMEAKARELSETEAFEAQMNYERKLREQDY